MKKNLLFVTVLAFQSILVHSQEWFLYKDFPLNVIPKDIEAGNDGTLFMLTTDFNYYYKTLNGEWTLMNQPILSNGNSILVDKNSNRMYIATGYLGIYYTSNFGNTWGNTYLTTNPVSGHHEGYLCFAGTENPNLFFAGLISFSPQITKFTNQGTSGEFKVVDPSMDPNSSAQSMYYTANQKLLIGTINNGIWVSENNANSFTQTGLTSGNVFKFTEDSNGRAYALRKDLETNEITLVSSDDYINWNTLELPDNESYTTLFYDNQSASLWVGNNSEVFKTPVSAITWQNQNLNNPDPNAVEIINDHNGGLYLFTVNEAAQRLNEDGNQWENQNNGLTGETNAISIDSDNRLFTYINFFSNRISSAMSPVESWSYVDLDPGGTASGVRNFSINPENEILSTTFNKIYKSNDNGATYTELNNPGITSIGIAKTGINNNLFLSGYFGNKLYRSTDEGQSWQEVFDGAPIFNSASITDFTQNENGELFLLLFDASNGFVNHLYGSTDSGETWNLLYENDSFTDGFTIEGKLMSFGSKNYIITNYSVFEINTSPGPPAEINLPVSPVDQIPILSFKRTGSGELLINYYLDEFYKSSDNGTSWTSFGRPVSSTSANPNPLNPAINLNDLPFWIISLNNQWNVPPGIYYYLEDSLNSEDVLKDADIIYPNPASDIIHIKTGYRGNCKILDFSGRLLMEKIIMDELTQINIKDLSAGIYILRFENGKSYKIIKR